MHEYMNAPHIHRSVVRIRTGIVLLAPGDFFFTKTVSSLYHRKARFYQNCQCLEMQRVTLEHTHNCLEK